MSRIRKGAIRPFIIVMTSVLLLTACPRVWYLSIVDVKDPLNPQFCLSKNYYGCTGSGIGLAHFVVDVVDDTGIKEPMWIIEPVENVALHRLTYGSVPAGWREISKSKPLKVGQWYSVDLHYFRFERVGNKIQVEMLSHEEFRNLFDL